MLIIRLPAISQKNLPDQTLSFTPIHTEFGALVRGVDLSQNLSDSLFAAIDVCRKEEPKLSHLGTEHDVACHRWQEPADEPAANNISS